MSKNRIRLQDRVIGELLTAGSTIGHKIPALGDKVGHSDHPGYAPLHWRVLYAANPQVDMSHG